MGRTLQGAGGGRRPWLRGRDLRRGRTRAVPRDSICSGGGKRRADPAKGCSGRERIRRGRRRAVDRVNWSQGRKKKWKKVGWRGRGEDLPAARGAGDLDSGAHRRRDAAGIRERARGGRAGAVLSERQPNSCVSGVHVQIRGFETKCMYL